MSTNYTQNYNLCQWEASDKVLREDFNADNAKLENALTAQQTAIEAAQATADAAFCPDYLPVVAGGYYGNGAASREIVLGFRPRAVLVLESGMAMRDNTACYSAMAVDGLNYITNSPLTITNSGFQVYYNVTGSYRQGTNQSNMKYFYLAIR